MGLRNRCRITSVAAEIIFPSPVLLALLLLVPHDILKLLDLGLIGIQTVDSVDEPYHTIILPMVIIQCP